MGRGAQGRTICRGYRATYGVRMSVIRRHTAPFGPFWSHGPLLPEGVLGVTAVAQRVGVSLPGR